MYDWRRNTTVSNLVNKMSNSLSSAPSQSNAGAKSGSKLACFFASSLGLVFFVALVAVVAWFGAQFPADQWYETLNKAPWTPPNLAFPIAWSILYCLIALVGWLIHKTAANALKAIWFVQLIFNAVWSWLFFGIHHVDLALLDILVLDALVIAFFVIARKAKLQKIAWLWLPYVLWLLLATTLNVYIVLFN